MKNLEKYYIKFDELKVGQKLWSIKQGEVTISKLSNNGVFPVEAFSEGRETQYTENGKFYPKDKYPSLFKSNPFESLKEEPRIIEVYFDNGWFEREAIGFVNEYAIVINPYANAPYAIDRWREIQPKIELTIEERLEKLEKEINNLKSKP